MAAGIQFLAGLIVVFIVSALGPFVSGAHTFDVYRMVQFERVDPSGNHMYGSQKSSFTLQATTVSIEDLSRSVVVIPFEELDLSVFDKVVQEGSGLLVLLPESQTIIPQALAHNWASIERALFTRSVKIPVYFAYTDPQIRGLYQDLKKFGQPDSASWLSDTYNLAVTSGDGGTPIKEVSVSNFQGWLPGTGGQAVAQGEGLPTIAIVAHYDTFALAPALAFGGDSNGSGVVALLELARLFSKLYSGVRTQGKYNILFVMTGGGKLNYAGAKHWLDTVDSRLLASLEFALCLDTISGDGSGLYFHVSRPPTDPKISQVFEDFNTTASQMGIALALVHKKINISDPKLSWEHEQFSRKRVLAATLSRVPSPSDHFSHSNILDNRVHVNITALMRNIRFIAESLAKFIYGYHNKELEVFEGSLGISKEFVASWLAALTNVPRAEAFTINNGLLAGLERALKEYTVETARTQTKVTTEHIFYGDTLMQMSLHRVKPVLFETICSVAIGTYLVSLYIMLRGVSDVWASITSAFVRKQTDTGKRK